jgi:hypothetical protein
MVPRAIGSRAPYVDVVAAMDEQPQSRAVSLRVLNDRGDVSASVETDPFADVEV